MRGHWLVKVGVFFCSFGFVNYQFILYISDIKICDGQKVKIHFLYKCKIKFGFVNYQLIHYI